VLAHAREPAPRDLHYELGIEATIFDRLVDVADSPIEVLRRPNKAEVTVRDVGGLVFDIEVAREELRAPVLVDDRGGSAGILSGSGRASRSPPDRGVGAGEDRDALGHGPKSLELGGVSEIAPRPAAERRDRCQIVGTLDAEG